MNRFSKHKIIPFSLEFILKIFPIANFSRDILIKYIQFLYKEKKSVTPVIIIGELSLSLSAVYKRQRQTNKQTNKQIDQVQSENNLLPVGTGRRETFILMTVPKSCCFNKGQPKETRVSPSRAPVFFLCPLLPSACYAGYQRRTA